MLSWVNASAPTPLGARSESVTPQAARSSTDSKKTETNRMRFMTLFPKKRNVNWRTNATGRSSPSKHRRKRYRLAEIRSEIWKIDREIANRVRSEVSAGDAGGEPQRLSSGGRSGLRRGCGRSLNLFVRVLNRLRRRRVRRICRLVLHRGGGFRRSLIKIACHVKTLKYWRHGFAAKGHMGGRGRITLGSDDYNYCRTCRDDGGRLVNGTHSALAQWCGGRKNLPVPDKVRRETARSPVFQACCCKYFSTGLSAKGR